MYFPVGHALFMTAVTSFPVFASIVGPGQLQYRQDGSSTSSQRLTITLSLDIPTVTYTEAAVTSAWGLYAKDCGPNLARTIQDALVLYNEEVADPPITDISNQTLFQFLEVWMTTNYPPYNTASQMCGAAREDIVSAEGDVAKTTTTSAAPTSSASSTSPIGSNTHLGDGTATPTATSPPSKDGAESNRPRMGVLSFVLISAALGMVW